MAFQVSPPQVDRRSTRDAIALLASRALFLAVLVLLGHFAFVGPTPSVCALLAVTLGAESITIVVHAGNGRSKD